MSTTIMGVRENPELLPQAVRYFSERWGIDERIYHDCMLHSLTTASPLPRFYLMMEADRIIGGFGLITNDFVSRGDLFPYLCALYIEEERRGNKLGADLLEHGRREAGSLGFDKLYLCTDHTNYYEKYDWRHIGQGYHPSGDISKIYEADTIKLEQKEESHMSLFIREMADSDPVSISKAFEEQGWNKPIELYERYLEEQRRGERVALIAEWDGVFAGYVNVLWNSYYESFRDQGIPEVNDFNVLEKFRRRGIGSRLMDRAEEIIRERSAVAGIGVGLFADYGNAQRLYVQRGYIPDGKGIYNGERYVGWGESVMIDDDIALYLTKRLDR
ncbi:GNAT family N-acetyltransferase [Gorillibacterium sp. sgz500922]|uniref:GNAT family N-acetyltransferase n=1 Tax=Gorillibacterium sp. sgz500922 TaxID=3446694 RepID=UPI003F67DE08